MQSPTPPAARMRTCQFCCGEIRAEAIKCRHCHSLVIGYAWYASCDCCHADLSITALPASGALGAPPDQHFPHADVVVIN